MSYALLSLKYDELMQDVPYEKWTDFFQEMIEQYGVQRNSSLDVLDLGCGTGRFLLYLLENQHQAIGMDLSEDMLTMAAQNLQEKHLFAPLFQQSMDNFVLDQKVDVVTIFCDALNYLLDEEAIKNTFSCVSDVLQEDGLLLFDVHSPYKMSTEFKDATYSMLADDYVVIWNTFLDEERLQVRHELTYFFQDEETGLYERIEESQLQRTFTLEQYCALLKQCGFTVLFVGDEEMNPPTETCTRYFICAKRI